MNAPRTQTYMPTLIRHYFAPVFFFLFFFAVSEAGEAVAEDLAESFSQVTVPLKSKGLNFTAKTVINGRVETDLLIDTGASFTIISESLARRIGFIDLDKAPRYPVSTIAGETWLRLVIIKSVNVDGAIAHNVEGAVSPYMGDGVDGALGLSFLSDFVYKINGKKKELTLKQPSDDEPIKGGRGRQWWRLKFKRYRDTIERYGFYLRKHENRLKAPNHAKEKNETKFTKNDLKRIINHYKKLHRALNKRAEIAGVPESWKS